MRESPPSKPPPLPPKPSYLASNAPPTHALPTAPRRPPVARGEPLRPVLPTSPEHCLRCGVVYAFGSAATTEKKAGEPSLVDSMEHVAAFQVAAGDSHGAILAGGARAGLYLWRTEGSDSVARPAVDTKTFASTRLRHVACGGALTAVVTEEGQLFVWALAGSSAAAPFPLEPCLILTAQRLGKVACGEGHVVAVSADGSHLLSWGMNDHGQLGLGPTAGGFLQDARIVDELSGRAIAQVAAGRRHTVILTEDGQLYAFGSNAVGQCGVPVGTADCLRSPHHHPRPFGTSAVRGVACGHYHTLILSQGGGDILACGLNKHGQLGLGSLDNSDKLVPVEKAPGMSCVVALGAGEAHSVAVTASSVVYAWGKGSKGQVGTAGLKKDVLSPKSLVQVHMGACLGMQAIACSANSTFILTVDDRMTSDNAVLFPDHAPRRGPAPPMQILTGTWNVNNAVPSAKSLEWLRILIEKDRPEMVVVGLQV